MKNIRELGAVQQQIDATDFVRLCHYLMRHDGRFSVAAMHAEEGKLEKVRGLNPRLLGILKASSHAGRISREIVSKAAVPAMGIASSPLQDFTAISSGFVNSLQTGGVFDRILADGVMAEVPLPGATVGAVVTSAAGYSVQEGLMKPLSRLSISGTTATPQKCHAALIISKELARTPIPNPLIQRELRNTVIVETDAIFINSMISGVTPATSFGTTAANVRADIEYLLRQIGVKANSRTYLIATPAMVTAISQKENGGQAAFPNVGPNGGEISPGLLLLPSDGVPVGYLIAVDASRIAGASSELIPEEIEEATFQLEDAPDSPPSASTNLVSLWQSNLTGIRIERWILAQKLTTNAVKIINNVNSYVAGAGSP